MLWRETVIGILTRTLIQLGVLLNITNLLELTNINLGEDLKSDHINQNKAAKLLSLLQHLTETLPPALSPTQENDFKQKGIRILKMRAYEKENGWKHFACTDLFFYITIDCSKTYWSPEMNNTLSAAVLTTHIPLKKTTYDHAIIIKDQPQLTSLYATYTDIKRAKAINFVYL